jgi:hypothetical protein
VLDSAIANAASTQPRCWSCLPEISELLFSPTHTLSGARSVRVSSCIHIASGSPDKAAGYIWEVAYYIVAPDFRGYVYRCVEFANVLRRFAVQMTRHLALVYLCRR